MFVFCIEHKKISLAWNAWNKSVDHNASIMTEQKYTVDKKSKIRLTVLKDSTTEKANDT